MKILGALASLSRPLHVLFASLTYVLGAAIARYLGAQIRPDIFWLGLVGIVLAQVSMDLLGACFRPATEPLVPDEDPELRRILRNLGMYTAITALAALGSVALVLNSVSGLSAAAVLSLGFSLMVILSFGVPPARLEDRGFGELLLAVQIAYLSPSIGFLLQNGSYHPLLLACILALTLLLGATLIAWEFPSFAQDLKYERSTLLTRLGWERASRVHHLLLLAAYGVLAYAAVLGFSFGAFLPAFLTLPFALLQVYFLRNISLGARPIWSLLRTNALAIFGLTVYFLTVSFWLR